MSTLPTAAKQLYCALIALQEDTLLLPNAVVAETIGQDLLTLDGSGPEWVLGHLSWSQRKLHALRFESLNGAAAQPLARRSRIVILQGFNEQVDAAPLALVAQGYPHLITVTRDAIHPLPLRASDNPACVLARVRLGNSEALIPDLDHLQELVQQLEQSR